jgi:predicted outer membrane repeat protein
MSALLLLASPLHAIDPTVSYVDPTATGSNDGTSWTNAFTSLQDALAIGTPADEIWVAQGTYYPDEGSGQTNDDRSSTFTLIDDVEIYGGFPNGGSPFAERDPGAHRTILSGDLAKNDQPEFANNDENAYHVLTAIAVSDSSILDGFTITAGNANGSTQFSLAYGGGLLCSYGAQPTVRDCSFFDNSARYGGGVYNTDDSSPIFTNCSFAENSASLYGAGIYNDSSSPVVTNCHFSSNSAQRGGGIYNNSSSPILTDCSVSNNLASSSGGGVYNNDSTPTVHNCRFSGNSASSGGGIYNNDSSPNITNGSFSGNTASSNGGGIYNGGGSSTNITNCSLSGNSASESGGGIYNRDSFAFLTNCSLSGNSALLGGGIYGDTFIGADGDPFVRSRLTNCILWNNRDSSGVGTANSSVTRRSGPSPIYLHCLVQGFNPSGTGNLDGTNALNNPRFAIPVDPASAPTTSGDLRLLAGSPALDAGNDTRNPTMSDLAGNPRKIGTIDLGALEGEVNDPAFFWNTDFDGDGHPFGIEIAMDMDPEAPNPSPLVGFTTGTNGVPVLTFPRTPTPTSDYVLKVMRSSDLSSGSFTEIFKITPTTDGSGTELGNTFSTLEDIITFHDQDPPPGSAFYRLEAEYVAPSS